MMKMMRKTVTSTVVVGLLFIVVGCTTHIHKVGNGPQTMQASEAYQWYILGGLIPLNEIDTNTMAGNATDYEITTEYSPIDILIMIPASLISVSRRTVTVTK